MHGRRQWLNWLVVVFIFFSGEDPEGRELRPWSTRLEKPGGETGGGGVPGEGPSGLMGPGLGGTGRTQFITKTDPFLLLLDCFFFSNWNNWVGCFGPFETLGDPFLRGPQGLLWNHFSSPGYDWKASMWSASYLTANYYSSYLTCLSALAPEWYLGMTGPKWRVN